MIKMPSAQTWVFFTAMIHIHVRLTQAVPRGQQLEPSHARIANSDVVVGREKRAGTAWNYWTDKAWGANLGNWLILEKWMDSSIFTQHAPGATDEWTFSQQATNPSKVLQAHWDTWVTEKDFKYVCKIGTFNWTVKLQVQYFNEPD